MTATVTITLVPMDAPTSGWCDRCALPSLLTQTFEVVLGESAGPGRLWTVSACTDCGSTLEER